MKMKPNVEYTTEEFFKWMDELTESTTKKHKKKKTPKSVDHSDTSLVAVYGEELSSFKNQFETWIFRKQLERERKNAVFASSIYMRLTIGSFAL